MKGRKKCAECSGELKNKMDFYKSKGEERYRVMKEVFKELTGYDIEEQLTGYNCVECGACYDEDMGRQDYTMEWLGEETRGEEG